MNTDTRPTPAGAVSKPADQPEAAPTAGALLEARVAELERVVAKLRDVLMLYYREHLTEPTTIRPQTFDPNPAHLPD